MTSKITISKIKHRDTIKRVSPTEYKYGRLHSAIIQYFESGETLDIIMLKKESPITQGSALEIEENDIVPGTRQTFQRDGITELSITKRRVAVGTGFFKKFKDGYVIEVILHQ